MAQKVPIGGGWDCYPGGISYDPTLFVPDIDKEELKEKIRLLEFSLSLVKSLDKDSVRINKEQARAVRSVCYLVHKLVEADMGRKDKDTVLEQIREAVSRIESAPMPDVEIDELEAVDSLLDILKRNA